MAIAMPASTRESDRGLPAKAATGSYADPDEIRTRFSKAMSQMYQKEVPLYGDLLKLVHDVNARAMAKDPSLRAQLEQRHELGASTAPSM